MRIWGILWALLLIMGCTGGTEFDGAVDTQAPTTISPTTTPTPTTPPPIDEQVVAEVNSTDEVVPEEKEIETIKEPFFTEEGIQHEELEEEIIYSETSDLGNSFFYPLYDSSLPFNFDIKAKVDFYSRYSVNLYFVPSKDEWDKFKVGGRFDYFTHWYNVRKLNRNFSVKKGEGIIVDYTKQAYFSSTGPNEVSLTINYLEGLEDRGTLISYKHDDPYLVDYGRTIGGLKKHTLGPFKDDEPVGLDISVVRNGTVGLYFFPEGKDKDNWLGGAEYNVYTDCTNEWITKDYQDSCKINGTFYIGVYNQMSGEKEYSLKILRNKDENIDISPVVKKFPKNYDD